MLFDFGRPEIRELLSDPKKIFSPALYAAFEAAARGEDPGEYRDVIAWYARSYVGQKSYDSRVPLTILQGTADPLCMQNEGVRDVLRMGSIAEFEYQTVCGAGHFDVAGFPWPQARSAFVDQLIDHALYDGPRPALAKEKPCPCAPRAQRGRWHTVVPFPLRGPQVASD